MLYVASNSLKITDSGRLTADTRPRSQRPPAGSWGRGRGRRLCWRLPRTEPWQGLAQAGHSSPGPRSSSGASPPLPTADPSASLLPTKTASAPAPAGRARGQGRVRFSLWKSCCLLPCQGGGAGSRPVPRPTRLQLPRLRSQDSSWQLRGARKVLGRTQTPGPHGAQHPAGRGLHSAFPGAPPWGPPRAPPWAGPVPVLVGEAGSPAAAVGPRCPRAVPALREHNGRSVPAAAPQHPLGCSSPSSRRPATIIISLDLSGIITETNKKFFHASQGKFSKLPESVRTGTAARSAGTQPQQPAHGQPPAVPPRGHAAHGTALSKHRPQQRELRHVAGP